MMRKKEVLVKRLLAAALIPLSLFGSALGSLYSTLDPTSVAQHFAFYELYPNTQEGREALKHAWELLSGNCSDCDPDVVFPSADAKPIISFGNRSGRTRYRARSAHR